VLILIFGLSENTPSGVTIHLVDEGIDTGPVLYQKYVNFDETEVTFSQTYQRLINEVESLFINKLDEILRNEWEPKPQRGKGSFHRLKNLPKEFNGWDSIIEDEILSLDKILGH
jgi:methionyl-tRNA formyltransferase